MKSYNYLDIKNPVENEEPSSFFMLNSFLRSRIKLGLESNETVFDEDVNIYITHLLDAMAYGLRSQYSGYLSMHDTDVALMAAHARNDRIKFEIYRQNADFLLIELGLFSESSSVTVHPLRFWEHEPGFYEKRTSSYYRFASLYAARAFGKNSALAEIMEKISNDLPKYLVLLRYVKSEYMNLKRSFTEGEFYHLVKTLEPGLSGKSIKEMHDEFLDIYSLWLKTGDEKLKSRVNCAAAGLREVDPDFKFTDL